MGVHDRIFLRRCNIEIDYPTIGNFELAVLTCLVPPFPGQDKIKLNDITANNISQDIIEDIIRKETTWDNVYRWYY
jgi:hypothetical protein